MRWPEFKDLLFEMRRETGSHLYANLAEMRLVMPMADAYVIAHSVAEMNQWLEKGAERLPMPPIWLSPAEAVPVTDDDRERAEAMLSGW